MSVRKLKIIALVLGGVVLVADQLIKFIFLWKIPANGIFLVYTNLFSVQIQIARNPFIAFSIPIATVLIYVLTLALLVGLLYLLKQTLDKKSHLTTICLSLIMGAALSNLFDRIVHGAVIDYLNLTVYNYHWATFNLADAVITTCAFIIIIINFRKKI